MQNKVQEGKCITFIASGTITAGDPIVMGQIPAFATISATNGTAVTAETEGVFTTLVGGINAGGNVAINNGDKLYFNSGDTPKVNAKATGIFFGYAYSETVAAGAQLVASGNLVTSIGVRLA